MKKIVLFVALLLTGNLAFAQLSKGNILVTGAFAISSSSSETTVNNTTSDGPTVTSVSFVPNVSYFLTDRFALGLELGLSNNTTEDKDINGNTTVTTKNVTGTFSVSPFVRYYVPLGQNFYFYGQGGFGVTTGGTESTRTSVTTFGNNTVTTENKSTSDISGFNVGLRSGITYFLNNRFALDASFGLLGVSNNTTKVGNTETSTSQFDFNIIPNSLQFGLSYRFGGTGN